jgi:glycosyltransferase involved in cell wall biosynthesis
MNSVKVSVVIPTYNRKDSLIKVLESLFDQTYPKEDYEIIICDDGSNDGTGEMIKRMMKESPCLLRYFKQTNKGPGSARNLGIYNAKGVIIGFTDDDCVASQTWIELAVPYFEDSKVGGVAGITLPEPYKKSGFSTTHTQELRNSESCRACATCNVFYRRSVLVEVGGFDPEFRFFQDSELALRIDPEFVLGGIKDPKLVLKFRKTRKEYQICFDESVKVYHNVTYLSKLKYLKSLKKYETSALFYKKFPVLRKNLILGFILNKKHIYPILMLLSLASFMLYLISHISFGYTKVFLLLGMMTYLWAYVLSDYDLKKYPLRVIVSMKYFIPDLVRLYYTLRGSVKYKSFLI